MIYQVQPVTNDVLTESRYEEHCRDHQLELAEVYDREVHLALLTARVAVSLACQLPTGLHARGARTICVPYQRLATIAYTDSTCLWKE